MCDNNRCAQVSLAAARAKMEADSNAYTNLQSALHLISQRQETISEQINTLQLSMKQLGSNSVPVVQQTRQSEIVQWILQHQFTKALDAILTEKRFQMVKLTELNVFSLSMHVVVGVLRKVFCNNSVERCEKRTHVAIRNSGFIVHDFPIVNGI